MEPHQRDEKPWTLMRRDSEPAGGETEPQAEMERIRQGLEKFPSNLVDWETTCLKNVADLLDGLQVARSEWEKFSSRIGEMRTALEAAKIELSEAHEEIARLKAGHEERADDEAALAALRERVDAVETDYLAATEELDALRAERDELAAGAAALRDDHERAMAGLRAERDRALGELRARADELEAEHAALRERLGTAERERDVLAEAGRAQAEASTDLKETKRRLEARQREVERLRKECESNTVQVCEFRNRIDRLEEQRDEARDEARKKARKIIRKVHAALDEAGAPNADEMSYGERIRMLRRRIETLEARLKHDP